jgi:hypothetical protein
MAGLQVLLTIGLAVTPFCNSLRVPTGRCAGCRARARCYENAMRWYSFDPFRHRTREQTTVGALRAEVGDHDVSIGARDTGRLQRSVGIELGKLAEMSTT